MVVLFALWFLLNWQFPIWLWVIAGLFLLTALTSPYKRKKRYKHIRSTDFPLALIMALIFGKDISGSPILPADVTFWSFAIVILGAVVLKSSISRPDKIYNKKKKKSKQKNTASDVDVQIGNDEDELKLHIKIKNKEKDKSSNFKISLENGFIKEKFVKNVLLKGMQNAWKDPVFHDEEGEPLFDIHKIYDKAKKNPIRGEILTIDNEKVTITISIN